MFSRHLSIYISQWTHHRSSVLQYVWAPECITVLSTAMFALILTVSSDFGSVVRSVCFLPPLHWVQYRSGLGPIWSKGKSTGFSLFISAFRGWAIWEATHAAAHAGNERVAGCMVVSTLEQSLMSVCSKVSPTKGWCFPAELVWALIWNGEQNFPTKCQKCIQSCFCNVDMWKCHTNNEWSPHKCMCGKCKNCSKNLNHPFK